MAEAFPRPFGPYVLLETIGRGAMGEVFLARPYTSAQGLPSPVVIKKLHQELAGDPRFTSRFRHEARLAVGIDNPHVARVYDVGAVGGALYFAMEHIAGWSLSELFRTLAAERRWAPVAAVAEVIDGVLSGLDALHSAADPVTGRPLGFVHRDVAPKNVMIGDDGLARIIDLGLGKSELKDWKTRTGAVIGTPAYMAPEQAVGGAVDHRSDLYAVGIIMFECLTMSPYIERGPVENRLHAATAPKFRPASSLRAGVPRGVDAVLERALALDPRGRFQSAREFRAALARAGVGTGFGELAELMRDVLGPRSMERAAELSRLLAVPVPISGVEDEIGKTVVFGRAAGVRSLDPGELETQAVLPAPPPPRASWIPEAVAVASLLATMAAAFNFYLYVEQTLAAPLPVPIVEPAPAHPEPAIAIEPEPGPEPEPEPEPTAPSPPPSPEPRSIRSPPRPARRAAPTPTAAPAPLDPRTRVRALLSRAHAALAPHDPQSDRAKAIRKIRSQLLLEASNADTERATLRIDALEAELTALEPR